MNFLKRVWKYTKRLVIALIVLILLTGVTMSIPSVQTKLAQYAAGFMYDEFGIEISLEQASFQFPNLVHLKKVYVPDHKGDTLIYADHITFGFGGFSDNHLVSNKVVLTDGKLLMRKYETDSLYNFAIWLEHFDSDTPSDTLAPPFRFSISSIEVRNMQYSKNPMGCDWCTFIDVYDADLKASDFKLVDSYVSADVDRLRFRDDRRFSLHDFSGFATFQSNFMAVEDMKFKTDRSSVSGSARLEYRTMDDLGDFLNKVHMEGEFKNSVLSSAEFQSYIPQFPSFDEVKVNGQFEGTVNDLYANRMDIALGDTKFFGDVHITDCTEPDDLYLDAFIGYCQTNGADIQKYVNPFVTGGLPTQLTQMSYIDLSGHYEGSIETFNTSGEIKSNLGNADVDLTFKNLSTPEIASYNGKLSLTHFDLGGLLEDETIGKVTGYGSVEGKGMTPKSATAKLDLNFAETEYQQYPYRNIKVKGLVADRQFEGDFSINDPRVSLAFTGDLDFSTDTASLDFIAVLDSADMYTTGFFGDTTNWLGAQIEADFAIYKDEWWQGSIVVDSLDYRKGQNTYAFDKIELNSSNAGHITRNSIESDILDGYIEGEYKLFEIHKPLLASLASVNSQYPYEGEHVDLSCEYNVVIKKPDILTDLFAPGVRIAGGTTINGSINSNRHRLDLDVKSPGVSLNGVILDTTTFNFHGSDGKYTMSADSKSLFMSSGLETNRIKLKSTIYPDSALLSLTGAVKDSVDSELEIKGYILQPEDTTVSFVWEDAQFNIGLDTLVLGEKNRLDIQPGRLIFTNYNFVGSQGELEINGVLSPQPYEILRVNLKKLDLAMVNYLLGDPNTYLTGNATGVLILNDVFNEPEIAADLLIDSLDLNEQHLGTLATAIEWDINSNVTRIDGSMTLGTLQTLDISGRIASDSADQVKLNFDFNRFRIAALNPYLQGILDNVRGMVEGTLEIAGTFEKPTLGGTLALPNAAFSVPFLGTDYNFEGSPTIHLSSDKIILDRVKITDTKENTSGIASGVISHNNLSDIRFDLSIFTNGMLGLDTEEGENNYFYGKAYAAGNVKIVGPMENLHLQIDVEAERGTSLKLPLTAPTEVGRNKFISFVDPTVESNQTAFNFQQKAKVNNLGGLSISVNAKMKPDAEVRLIMDEAIGGVIQGKGEGMMRINLSSAGDLTIFGGYSVEDGEYLFNMSNVLTKRFTIQSGSTLNWSGDPFEAEIDLKATYSTRTTLTGMVSTSSGYSGQRVTVNLTMHLTGPLMNPQITFDIEVPNVSSAWQEELKNRLNDQDKLTDNAFSLLAVNSFSTANNSLATDVVQENMDQMASLMSNWAAKSVFGDFADVSLNYNSYSESENTQGVRSEWEVGISKPLFDDRFVLNSNIDIPVNDGDAGASQTITGDVEVEYKITEDGRLRAKAFNRSNQNNPGLDQLSAYTQGVSVFYRADFNTWPELVEQVFGALPVEEGTRDSTRVYKPVIAPADTSNVASPDTVPVSNPE